MEEKKDMVVSPDKKESLKIYARVRKIMPWEPKKKAIKFTKSHIEASSAKGRHRVQSYEFSEVFSPSHDNQHCFEQICQPMCKQVLDGFNAVMIAYGQTGSGKTHSLLGKPKRNVLGILPMVLEYFLNCENVKVTLGAVEAFGHHVNKIELFDLFNENSQSKCWSEKWSKTSLDERETVFVTPEDGAHSVALVTKAQKASHFAPTGKNPESSRGHISFIVKVIQERKSEHQRLVSHFLIVDLAGSEGETAFTPEFKRKVDPSTLMARRLEAGVINTGLSQLQIIFNELKVKGRLSGMRGVGLRRVLHPYINTKSVLSVLFCISPSKVNQKATIATLKFAVQAGMVKVKPIKEAVMTNWPLLVEGLKEMIANLNQDIDVRETQIRQQTEEINRLMELLESADGSDHKRAKSKLGRRNMNHLRKRSVLPGNLVTMLGDVSELQKEAEIFDDMDTADVDEFEIDAEMKQGIDYARCEKEAVASVLGKEREELIRKSTTMFQSQNYSEAMNERILNLNQKNMAEAFTAAATKPEDDSDKPIDYEQDHMATDDFTRDQLVDRCEVLESMLQAEKSLNESYLYSQQVIIDHLAETNEGLLQFFRVKMKVFEKGKKEGKKEGKKKRSKKAQKN